MKIQFEDPPVNLIIPSKSSKVSSVNKKVYARVKSNTRPRVPLEVSLENIPHIAFPCEEDDFMGSLGRTRRHVPNEWDDYIFLYTIDLPEDLP